MAAYECESCGKRAPRVFCVACWKSLKQLAQQVTEEETCESHEPDTSGGTLVAEQPLTQALLPAFATHTRPRGVR